jgi:hypothetical protein
MAVRRPHIAVITHDDSAGEGDALADVTAKLEREDPDDARTQFMITVNQDYDGNIAEIVVNEQMAKDLVAVLTGFFETIKKSGK